MRRVELLLLLVVSLAACGRTPPNVLLITVDTTRADALGCYGSPTGASPELDRLAAESTLFERAYAHVPITLPSHTTMMTGMYPSRTGVRDNGRDVVPGSLETLAEMASHAGYATAAFVSAFVLDSRFGLDQGFSTYDDDYMGAWTEEDLRDARAYAQMIVERPADQTTDRALAWLEARDRRPFFLWVHYYDPHQRHDPPQPYRDRFLSSPYAGEIAFMDAQIGRLLDRLRSEGVWDETLAIVVGDHGEGLGQHGEASHAILAYDSTLRVPLLVKAPAAAGQLVGRAVGEVRLIDLQPTVTELLGWPRGEGIEGRSLVPALRGDALAPRRSVFECLLPNHSFGWDPLIGVRWGPWKYIHSSSPELFHVENDPDETTDLAAVHPEQLDEGYRLLSRAVAESEAGAPASNDGAMSAEVAAKLRSLGYFGGGGEGENVGVLERRGSRSPRHGTYLLRDFYAASTLTTRNQWVQAAAILDRVLVPLDPENPTFLRNLADLERRLGHTDRALEVLARAQALDPNDVELLVDIGQLELDRGRLDAAEALFLAAGEIAPDAIRPAYFAAVAAQRQQAYAVAVERFEAVLALDPTHLDTLRNLGLVLTEIGALTSARTHWSTALQRSPLDATAHYNLGVLERRAGRLDESLRRLERSIDLRQPYPQARYLLGLVLIDAARPGDAQRAFEALIAESPTDPLAAEARRQLDRLGR